ncbi:MAG: stage III sporulation AC/AD family protein [Clostridia bacterium]|nr:stage III sporulation AC/AD family protein [Clostridia bacterium]
MNGVITVSAAAAFAALIISAVRKTEPGIGGVLSVFLTVWIVFLIARGALYVKDGLAGFGSSQIGEYLPYLIKCAGIGFFSQTAADVCRDCGEASAGSKIITAGKLGILAVCLPLIKNVLSAALGYING